MLADNGHAQESKDGIRKRSSEGKTSLQSSSTMSRRSSKGDKIEVNRMIEEDYGRFDKHQKDMHLKQPSAQPGISSSMDVSNLGNVFGEPASAQISSTTSIPEFKAVTGEKTLLRTARIPDEFPQPEITDTIQHGGRECMLESAGTSSGTKPLDTEHLRILVAEDDPINSRIIEKRLERSGHEVHITINGKECAVSHEKPAFFDVVLMDMQVSTLYL
jgi:hypothetical protein